MINIYTLNDSDIWRAILRDFKKNDIYYSPEYVNAYKKNGDGEPILIYYKNDIVEAINVVIKRDISNSVNFSSIIEKNKYYDLITPYGYGGILLKDSYEEENIRTFVAEYKEFCKSQNIISEFIRFHPIYKNYQDFRNFIDIVDLGPTVYVNTTDIKLAWDNFSAKNRNVIRKSRKCGVKVFWGVSEELKNNFIDMYYETMDRDNADKYYYFTKDYFDSLLHDLKYNILFFYAKFNDQIISISTIIFGNKNIHYHLSASKFEYRYLAPTNLILFEVINYAYNNGLRVFHLGGGLGGEEDTLYSFKKSFNKNEDLRYKIGKIIFDNEIYSVLSKRIIVDMDSTYFPIYRKEIEK